MVWYCSQACQKRDWRQGDWRQGDHRIFCEKLVEAGVLDRFQMARENDPEFTFADFQGNEGIDAVGLANILEKNTHLEHVSLADCDLDNETALALAKTLKVNETLLELNLGLNNVKDEGAEALAQALKVNTTLQTLIIWGNTITDRGAQALLDALEYNSTIACVNVKNLMFSSVSWDASIAQSIPDEIDTICRANQAGRRHEIVAQNKSRNSSTESES